jgi:hypothetical protein
MSIRILLNAQRKELHDILLGTYSVHFRPGSDGGINGVRAPYFHGSGK